LVDVFKLWLKQDGKIYIEIRLILFMMIDVTRMSSRGQVVIPLEMRKDLKEGDKLIVIRRNDEIVLKKSLPESAILSEKSLGKTWLNKKEDEAWENL
jgi:AbrB family looped-hinge helix DNA binding protein